MVSDQRCHRNADKGVKAIPDEIQAGNFIGHKLRAEQGSAGDKYPVVTQ